MSSYSVHQFAPVRSYSDLTKQPGHISRFSPAEDKVVAVLYHYHFKSACQCGISGCGKWHNDGFVVKLESHLISQIGHTCWQTKFKDIGEVINRFQEEQERPRLVDALKQHKLACQKHREFLSSLKSSLQPLVARKANFKKLFPRLYAEIEQKSDTGGNFEVTRDHETIKESSRDIPKSKLRAEDFDYRSETLATVRGTNFLKSNALVLLGEAEATIELVEKTNLVDIPFSKLSRVTTEGAAIDDFLSRAQTLLRAGEALFSIESAAAISQVESSKAVRAEARRFNLNKLDTSIDSPRPASPKKLARAERRKRIYWKPNT